VDRKTTTHALLDDRLASMHMMLFQVDPRLTLRANQLTCDASFTTNTRALPGTVCSK
jgi:hypothetical protein